MSSNSKNPPSPMLAHQSDTGRKARSRAQSEAVPLLPLDAEPDTVVDEILGLLGEDRDQTASRMAAAAVVRFPENRRVQGVWRVFDTRAEAIRRPGKASSRGEEFDWLRNPPESARGKWVALVGREMVAIADTLADLVVSLRSLSLAQTPLVHQLD